jgi:hypothetical protein
MAVYVGIFLFLAFISLTAGTKQQEKVFVVLSCVFLFIFTGTRFETGCDYAAYLNRYNYYSPLETAMTAIQKKEGGFELLMHFVTSNGMDYMWLNIFSAAIFLCCLHRFLSWHSKPTLLLALMFPILIVQLSMSGLRQALATAFLMLALRSFMNRARFFVALFIVIGAMFHQSVLIFLPLVFIVGKTFSTARIIIGVAIMAPVVLVLLSARLDVYDDRYLAQIYGNQESAGALFRLGLMLVTAVLFEVYKKQMEAAYPQEYPLMRLFSLIIFALIPMALVSSVAVHRLGFYLLPMQLFILAAMPYAVFDGDKDRKVAQVMALGLYGAYITVWFSISRHAQVCYMPYESFLSI